MTAVRVGIVTWNSAECLERCLEALPAALAGAGIEAEIVVVDNASADASASHAAGHEGVRVIVNDENRGYARAMNQALGSLDADAVEPAAEVLIALNPDTVPAPGSLAGLAHRLAAEHDVGLAVPRLEDSNGNPQPSAYRFPSVLVTLATSFLPLVLQRGRIGARLWLEAGARYDRSADIDWAIGAVHAIRTAALAGRPPYSERWFMYGEDIELCWRLAADGWRRRLDCEATVVHVGNASGALAWGADRDRRWLPVTYDFYRRAHGRPATVAWALANVAGTIAAALRLLATSLGGGRRGRARRGAARALVRLLPIHLRAASVGPPAPDPAPPRSPDGC